MRLSTPPPRVVLDTNVIFAAAWSQNGASQAILRLLVKEAFLPVLTHPLYTEYETVLRRRPPPGWGDQQIKDVLAFLCSASLLSEVHFTVRPHLTDPGDDLVLEAAVAGGAPWIVTHNLRDFRPSHLLGIQAISPAAFLSQLRSHP